MNAVTVVLAVSLAPVYPHNQILIADDDSGEGTVQTEQIVKELQSEQYPVRIHVRRRNEV